MKKQVDRATKNEVFQLQEQARLVFEYKQQGNQKEKKDRQALNGEVVSAGLRKELKGLENLEFQGMENRRKKKATVQQWKAGREQMLVLRFRQVRQFHPMRVGQRREAVFTHSIIQWPHRYSRLQKCLGYREKTRSSRNQCRDVLLLYIYNRASAGYNLGPRGRYCHS